MTSQAPTQGPTDAGLTARVLSSEWQPIETAPHGETVLLGWWNSDGLGGSDWICEVACASFGWRRGSISNMSRHGKATNWQPLPTPPINPKGAA